MFENNDIYFLHDLDDFFLLGVILTIFDFKHASVVGLVNTTTFKQNFVSKNMVSNFSRRKMFASRISASRNFGKLFRRAKLLSPNFNSPNFN